MTSRLYGVGTVRVEAVLDVRIPGTKDAVHHQSDQKREPADPPVEAHDVADQQLLGRRVHPISLDVPAPCTVI